MASALSLGLLRVGRCSNVRVWACGTGRVRLGCDVKQPGAKFCGLLVVNTFGLAALLGSFDHLHEAKPGSF